MKEIEKIWTIAYDNIKRELSDKKTIAILFIYFVVLSLGMKFGSLLGLLAKLLFVQTDLPVQIVVTYYTSAIWVPLLAILLSFDAISGETSTNSMSYLAVRAERASIILGKYISTAMLIAGINLVMYLGAATYFQFKTGKFMMGDAMLAWAYLVFYSLVFISLGFFCSTVSNKHHTALWAAISITAVALLVSARESVQFLSPFHYIGHVLEGEMTLGIAALTIFAGAGIISSIIIFKRKDL